MAESINNIDSNDQDETDKQKLLLRAQYDAVGTPMPVKTPVDFQKRLKEQEIE